MINLRFTEATIFFAISFGTQLKWSYIHHPSIECTPSMKLSTFSVKKQQVSNRSSDRGESWRKNFRFQTSRFSGQPTRRRRTAGLTLPVRVLATRAKIWDTKLSQMCTTVLATLSLMSLHLLFTLPQSQLFHTGASSNSTIIMATLITWKANKSREKWTCWLFRA